MDRRAFLKTSAAVAASASLSISPAGAFADSNQKTLPEGQPAHDGYVPPAWLHYSRAVYFEGYTSPVFPYVRDFDAERLVGIVRELGGDTLRFQPLCALAFYPSKVLPEAPELKGRDLINEVSAVCRKTGIHLYCYWQFGSIVQSPKWIEEHPQYSDWVLRDPDGKLDDNYSTGYGWGPAVRVCSTGDAYRQALRQMVRELSEHDIDGVYFDAPSAFEYTGYCYCESCKRSFHAASNMDLDRLENKDDLEAKVAWFRWWNELSLEDLEACREILHKSGKFMLCHNGGSWRDTSLRTQYRIPDGFMVEHSTQIYERLTTGLMGASMARPYGKIAQMYLGGYCVSNFNLPPHCKPWAVHGTNLEDGDEILMEGFTNLACGNLPLYVSANRKYYGIGSGSDHPVREIYAVMQRAEPLIKDSVPVPDVSVVMSWEALQGWRTGKESWNVNMSRGFVLAMLDERVSLEIQPSTEMTAEWLSRQRVVALCGASGVSEEQAHMLGDWVRNGGSLLATYDTGLYNEVGVAKPGGMLRDVLGVELKGGAPGALPEMYYRPTELHPALGGYKPGDRFMGDTELIPVSATGNARVIAECWNLGLDEVRGPAIIVNELGKGRTVYIAGSLEAHYISSRVASLRRVLASIVRYLAGDAQPLFAIDAPRGVYGVLRRTTSGDRVLWVLANVGFKDASDGRMRQEFVTLSNVTVRILPPEGKTAKAVHLIRAGLDAPFTMKDGYVTAVIPSLYAAEMVHLELS
ncbi:MAG TPA: beta-galactosidase trimerization domain-containing protein [Terracidiphilus sp.]|nr:beta-galactosidase trimerization domain-containing protein [Terracidiphilus sp.]